MQSIEQIDCDTNFALSTQLSGRTTPLVLRNLVKHWPLVQQALRSDQAVADYLRSLYPGVPVQAFFAEPEAGGRFFYNADMSGFNFSQRQTRLDTVLDGILQHSGCSDAPVFYMGSTTADYCTPGLTAQNPLQLDGVTPLISLWLGNRSHVVAHYDVPDNIACVGAGKRRFTLFAPQQLANLYPGPFDFTPAGQPVSMVDARQPDFARYPKYRDAQQHALVAELEAGDAIYIPSMWWHQVEGLSELNVLVNYWWRKTPSYCGLPTDALLHAMLSIRDLPPAQRQIWQQQFEHYVFNADEQTSAHLPADKRGVLAPMLEQTARKLRAMLLNRLNR